MSLPSNHFHGEFSSSDASALNESSSRFSLYAPGATAALTLDSNDMVVIHDICVTTGASLTVSIYDGSNNAIAAGELITKVIVNGTALPTLAIPHFCQKGTYPKVLTSGAGQVDVIIRGSITRIGN